MRIRGITFVSVLLLTACGDGPTAPPLRVTPTPPSITPTPVPPANVAGTWTGTLDGLCRLDHFAANVTANFVQDGSIVTGSMTGGGFGRSCGFGGAFNGTVSANFLTGTVGGVQVAGGVTSTEMNLRVSNSDGLFGLSATLRLQR